MGALNRTPLWIRTAADAVMARPESKESFPFWWTTPSERSQNVNFMQSAQCPVGGSGGAFFQVMEYDVPDGLVFVMRGVLVAYASGAPVPEWTPGDGNITLKLDINVPATTASSPQGVFAKDFGTVITPLGSIIYGPWPIFGRFIFNPRDKLRWKAVTSALIPPTAFLTAGVFGWTEPLRLAREMGYKE